MADRVSWVGSPNTRGTMDILWGCLTTLGLCVWTAVHPNIQLHASRGRNLSIRILLMLTAVIFPEIVISAALRQRSLASSRRVTTTVTTIQMTTDKDPLLAKATGASAIELQDAGSSNMARRHVVKPNQNNQDLPLQYGVVISANGNIADPDERTQQPSVVSDEEATSSTGMSAKAADDFSSAGVIGAKSFPDTTVRKLNFTRWNRQQLYFVVMGGLTIELPGRQRYFFTLNALPFLEMENCLPEISTDDVDERSNADVITKIIVLGQTVWFAIQIVARLASRLSVTALEVHTSVHVACAIVMYGLWWDKPYNVSRSIEVHNEKARAVAALLLHKQDLEVDYQSDVQQYEREMQNYWANAARVPKPIQPQRSSMSTLLDDTSINQRGKNLPDSERELQALARKALKSLLEKDAGVIAQLDRVFEGIRTSSENFTALRVWGSWTEDYGHDWNFDKFMHILFNLLYGAGHLAAWSSNAFPTNIERWLWRVSSLMLVAVVVWATLWTLFWKATRSRLALLKPIYSGELNFLIGPFFCLIMLAYIMARCYFLVEALISLRSLPASAYQLVQWTYFLPHAS